MQPKNACCLFASTQHVAAYRLCYAAESSRADHGVADKQDCLVFVRHTLFGYILDTLRNVHDISD
jgi:hypothetical protein